MDYVTAILSAAKSAGVSASLLLAICTHESGLKNTLVPHDGGSPSYGICQIKAGTAELVGFKGKPQDLMKPEVNAKFAALYLKYQLDRYNQDSCKAVSAYNMGTFKESVKHPGQPMNFGYLVKIQNKSVVNLFPKCSCGREVAQLEP